MRFHWGISKPILQSDVGKHCHARARGLLTLVLAMALCLTAAQRVIADPPTPGSQPSKQVLILHSYHQGLTWTDREDEGIRKTLNKRSDIRVSTEYLDAKRFPLEAIEASFATFLTQKYRTGAFDAVIATDNSALTFLSRYHRGLFPDTPVIFCGVNNYLPSMIKAFDGNASGVVQLMDPQGTIDLIKKLQPDLRNLVVVSGTTPTAQAIRNDVEKTLNRRKDSFNVVWINGPDTKMLRERLAALSAKDAVLLCNFNRDADQVYYSHEDGARLIAEASKAPVYAMEDLYIGTGVLGGSMMSPVDQGAAAARLCLQVLQTGEVPDVITHPAVFSMFDYPVLTRFGWTPSDLPKHAVVLNHPASFYDRHKALIWETTLTFLFLILALFVVTFAFLRARAAAKALRRNEENLSTTLNSIGDGVIATDLEGNVIRMNPVAEKLTGWQLTDAVGKPLREVFEIVNVLTREPAPDPVRHVIESGRKVGLANHTMLIAKDGAEYQIADSASPIRGEDQAMIGVVLVFRDVTEEYRIQEQLHHTVDSLRISEQQRREAQEIAKLGHWSWDIKTGDVDWSEEVFQIFGLDPKIFKPQIDSIMALSPWPGDSQRHQELIDRAIKDRTRGNYEQRFLRPDGSTGYYISTFWGVYDEDGELIVIKGVVQDITHRKQAEILLRLTQRSVDESRDAALWVRPDARFAYANDAACQSLGYTREELLQLSVRDIDPSLSPEEWPERVAAIKKEGTSRFTTEQRRKDGSFFPVEVSVNYVEVEGEEIFLAFCADITEKRRHEQQLLESESRFRELFDNMANGVAVYKAVDDGADFVFVDFNHAGEKIDDIAKDDIVGQRLTEVFPGAEDFGLLDTLRRVWKTGKAEHHPVTLYSDQRIEGWRENFAYRLPSGEVVAVYNDVTERVRAEEERDRLFNHSIDMLCVAGFDGSLKQLNPAFTRTLGWSEEELTAKPYLEFVHPDDVNATMAMGERLAKGIAVHGFENRYRCKDGTYRWLSWNSFPLVGQGQILAVCRDITDQKAAAETLRQSEERYRLAQRLSGVGTWEWDIATDHVFWSDEVAALWGLKPGQFHGTYEDVAKHVHPDDFHRWKKSMRVCVEDGVEHNIEFRVIWPDGSVHWLVGFGDAERDQTGKAVRVVGMLLDATARKQGEEALKESERSKAVLLTNLPGMSYRCAMDPEWTMEFVSQGCRELTGYDAEDLVGNKSVSFNDIIAPDYRPILWNVWQDAVQNHQLVKVEYEIITRSGERKWVWEQGVPIYGDDGTVIALEGMLLDITDRKKAEQELEDTTAFLDTIVNESPFPMWVSGPDGYLIRANRALRATVKLGDEDPIGGYNLLKDENAKKQGLDEAIRRVFEEGIPMRFTLDWKAEDAGDTTFSKGRDLHADAALFPIKDAAGRLTHVVCQWVDITDRKKAEQDLAEATAFLDTIVDESPFAMWVANPDGDIIRTNRAMREALGLPDDTVRGFYNILKDDNLKKHGYFDLVQSVFKGAKPARFTTAWRAQDSGYDELQIARDVYIDVSMFPILGSDGRVSHVVCQWVDITDRKKAEQELEATTAFLDTIVNESPYAMWVARPDGTLIRINRSVRGALNLVDDRILNRYNVLQDENILKQGKGEAVRAVFEEGKPARFNLNWRSAEVGDIEFEQAYDLHIDIAMFPILDAAGQVTHVVGQWVDITDRVRAEEAVKNSERLLNDIIQGTPVAAFVIGKDHKVLYWNRALEELSGISKDAVLGTDQQWRAFYPEARPCFADLVLDQNTEALEQYYGGKYATSSLIPDAYEATDFYPQMGGDGRWLRFTVAMIRDAEGQPVGAVEMLIDITDRVRAEEAVKNSERLLNDVLQGTPVAAFVIGKDHKVLHWNRALAELSGIPENEIVGTTDQWRAFYAGARPCLADVVLDQNFEFLETYYAGKYRDSVLIPEAYEATDYFPKMGEDGRWLRFTVALIRDAEGQPVGAVEMLLDITEQMQAEAALRESEDKHRTLFETMAQGVLYRNAEGRITDANPAALEILGVSFDELVERGDYDAKWQAIHEDGSPLSGGEYPSVKALRTGKTIHSRVMGIYNAEMDTHRWLNVNAVPRFRPGEEKPYQVYTTLEDITERRREEQVTAAQLRLIEFAAGHSTGDLLRHFLDEAELLTGSQIGFYHFLEADQETLSLQAWSTNTLDGMCTAEGVGAHYSVSKAGVWVEAIRQRRPVVHNDYQSLPHKKGLPPGHAPIIRELVVPVLRGDKIVAILGVGNKHIDYNQGDIKILQQLADLAWEIVVRKQAEEKLRDSERRFRVIFEQAAVGVAVIATQTGRFARLNQRYADILGYSREEMRNISFQEITHPEDLPEDQENMQRLLRGETSEYSMEKRYYHKDGSIIWVNLFVSAMWNLGDKPEYHIAVVEDITERKRAEEELFRYRQHLEELVDARTQELEAAHLELIRRERLATLGRLTATVSHELRNPLGTIRGSLFTINRATQGTELGIQRALERAQRNIDRCDGIINELLDYTRSTVPEPEPTNLDDWLTEILDEQAIPEGITLERSFQTNLELPLDREKLRRCVVNLVTNAYQAIQEKDPPEGRIAVETESKDDKIEIRVLDTGPGIDAERQEKIFEPLYSTKGFGVGLGLSIVKQLIEAAGGGISIASTPGSGTNATLWLPLAGMDASKQPEEVEDA